MAVAAVMVSLAVPSFAGVRDEEWKPGRIGKIIAKLVIKSLGDGIICPRP